jgi:hypothetical protein
MSGPQPPGVLGPRGEPIGSPRGLLTIVSKTVTAGGGSDGYARGAGSG